MPQAIPLIAGYVASGLVAAAGTYAWVAALAGGIVAYGTTKLFGLDDQPGLPEPGIQANVKGTVQPIPIVYGKRRIGGVLAQVLTTGKVTTSITIPTLLNNGQYDVPDTSDNKYLNLIVVWCEGEVEGVQHLYFDDKQSDSTQFTDAFIVDHFTGTDDQAAATRFLTALSRTFEPASAARLWSADHRLRGLAYSYIRLKYGLEAWPTGIPAVTTEIKGRKVLDLRTDTWGWSDNPALIVYDYLTNTRFGRGIDPAELDTESFIDAANYCDQVIFIETQAAVPPDVPQAGVSQARYACDAVLNPDDTHLDNLRVLLGTCRGALVFSGGLYKLKLDKPETPSFALTEDNIVGGWNILLESSDSRYNRVHAQWINRSQRYQDDFAILESPTFLEADNNEVLEARIDLPATTNYLRPIQMAGMVLRQSRYSLQCELTATIAGLNCEVFDVVTVTHSIPGWDEQLFRVMAISIESDDQVRLQLRQYADDVYDLDSQNDEDSPPPTNLPDPRVVRKPSVVFGNGYYEDYPDGTWRCWVVMEWIMQYVPPANLSHFEVRWRPAGTDFWTATTVLPDNFQVFDTTPGSDEGEVITGDAYIYRHEFDALQLIEYEMEVRAVNLLGVRGLPAIDVAVGAGSLVPASAPANVHLSGDPNGIRLRWDAPSAGTSTEIYRTLESFGTGSFSGATKIATVTGSLYTDLLPITTVAGYWLRHLSASGVAGAYSPAETGEGAITGAGVPAYASDADAGAAGLIAGDLWRDSSAGFSLKVKT